MYLYVFTKMYRLPLPIQILFDKIKKYQHHKIKVIK